MSIEVTTQDGSKHTLAAKHGDDPAVLAEEALGGSLTGSAVPYSTVEFDTADGRTVPWADITAMKHVD